MFYVVTLTNGLNEESNAIQHSWRVARFVFPEFVTENDTLRVWFHEAFEYAMTHEGHRVSRTFGETDITVDFIDIMLVMTYSRHVPPTTWAKIADASNSGE